MKEYNEYIERESLINLIEENSETKFDWSECVDIDITVQKPHPSKMIHPTQKPVELLEWLINTYTNENDLVLDNCMGSGSTGVACLNTNRNFMGMEKDKTYFKLAEQRIKESEMNKPLW